MYKQGYGGKQTKIMYCATEMKSKTQFVGEGDQEWEKAAQYAGREGKSVHLARGEHSVFRDARKRPLTMWYNCNESKAFFFHLLTYLEPKHRLF